MKYFISESFLSIYSCATDRIQSFQVRRLSFVERDIAIFVIINNNGTNWPLTFFHNFRSQISPDPQQYDKRLSGPIRFSGENIRKNFRNF